MGCAASTSTSCHSARSKSPEAAKARPRALLLLGRYQEALDAAMAAAEFGGLKEGYRLAEIARQHLR